MQTAQREALGEDQRSGRSERSAQSGEYEAARDMRPRIGAKGRKFLAAGGTEKRLGFRIAEAQLWGCRDGLPLLRRSCL